MKNYQTAIAFRILIVALLTSSSVWAQDKQNAPTLISPKSSVAAGEGIIKALLIDGQNNHGEWPKTTVLMRQVLEATGKFSVDIERTQFTMKGGKLVKQFPLDDGKTYKENKRGKTDPEFHPKYSDYHVVISNFGHGAADWPEATQKDFEKYMSGGGGLVVVHAADNSFPQWVEYNKMIGLGGWGKRTEKAGPYVYYDKDEKEVRDTSAGKGGDHGPRHEFSIVSRNAEHPIMKGLPTSWLHTRDELYSQLRGPAENMSILATAWADKKFKGTQRHEPMLMVIDYGKGRVFHTTLVHDVPAMSCVGYQTVLFRGPEWAATGKVTLTDLPENFPTSKKSSSVKFEVSPQGSSKKR